MDAPVPSFYVAALLALCCALTVPMAGAGCSMTFEENKPVILKVMGTRRVQLRTTLAALQLSSNESVTTLCMQGTSISTRYSSFSGENFPWSMTWRCIDNTLSCNVPDIDTGLRNYGDSRLRISCTTQYRQSVYVSNVSLPDCEQDTTLLIGAQLARQTVKQPNTKTLALCYDLSRLLVRYISYIAYPQRNVLDERVYADNELETLRFDEMLFDFMNFFDFMSEQQFSDAKNKLHEQLPAVVNNEDDFVLASLLQDAPLQAELKDFEEMLSIVWLKQLLHGNWRNFLQALRTRSDEVRYAVHLGTSDVIVLPSLTDYNKTQPLIFRASQTVMAAPPKYVWAHLRTLHTVETVSTPYNTEDFVIVALNTPYFASAHALCEDICDRIPWLRDSDFGKLHLLPHYGVVNCCHISQVAHKLTGLPQSHNTLSTPHSPPPTPHTPRTLFDTTEQSARARAQGPMQPYPYSNENMVESASGDGYSEYD